MGNRKWGNAYVIYAKLLSCIKDPYVFRFHGPYAAVQCLPGPGIGIDGYVKLSGHSPHAFHMV
ncbi:hypothetical protein SDC9_200730 [bioreactor metagenome]|uniref:Uncharacterized protein n=1 Tax=bioreactor metagenome TaxID=1076179 RepID=A0A645IPA0_9ZZZZ